MPGRSTSGDSGWTSDRLDAVFVALADEQRRQTLRYFQTVDEDAASVEDLIEYTIDQTDKPLDRAHLELKFHHVVLPKLADQGVIEYDARSETVMYDGSPAVEQLLAAIAELDRSAE